MAHMLSSGSLCAADSRALPPVFSAFPQEQIFAEVAFRVTLERRAHGSFEKFADVNKQTHRRE
jgi:hypothetical protein